jgi:hypothetical protein
MHSRREFLRKTGSAAVGVAGALMVPGCASPRTGHRSGAAWFQTRGVVLVVKDMQTLDWPALAKAAGLTTLATHIKPSEIAEFVQTESGQKFLEGCRRNSLQVEHELHALEDLLPRDLFAKDKSMFRMDDKGERVREWNLCVHSGAALEVAAEKAAHYSRILRSTTGRYFYWIDDGMPMCRCPKCRGYSDSDQALIFENHLLGAIRKVDARAQLAHLAYTNTLTPPKQVKPIPGIFLEFAPIDRRYDTPFSQRDATSPSCGLVHGEMLDALDANLEWFGREGAQVLEYWLDVSRYSGWKREQTVPIPWNETVFREDYRTYALRGIRHVTTFAAWLDGDYAKRWGVAPVHAYGEGLRRWRRVNGQPHEQA